MRSMEWSLARIYIVDLSGPAPWDELCMLQGELQKHAWDMRAWRMVIVNKADLLGGDGNPEEVRLARAA